MAGETVIINGHVISDVENVDKARAIGPDTVFLGGSSDDGQKLKEGTAGLVPVGRLDEHTLEEMQKSFYTKPEMNDKLNEKADKKDTYTKSEVDDKLTYTSRLTGNPLVFTSAEASFKEFKILGKTEQFSTEGKNLADINDFGDVLIAGITWSCKDGVITAKGSATATSSTVSNILFDGVGLSGTYALSTTAKNRNILVTLKTVRNGVTEYKVAKANEPVTFSLTGTETEVKVFPQVQATGVSIDESFGIQLELGSTATSYEPYTGGKPSPSPDYPQDIKTAGASGSIVTKVGGKNLLNMLDFNGCVATSDNSWHFDSLYGVNSVELNIKAPSTIFFEVKCETGGNSRFYVTYDDGTRADLFIPSDGAWNQFSKKFTKNIKSITTSYSNNKPTDFRNVQLEIGSVATSYEPFKPVQTLTSSTPNGMNGMNGVYDERDYATGKDIKRYKILNLKDIPKSRWSLQADRKRVYTTIADSMVSGSGRNPFMCTRFSFEIEQETVGFCSWNSRDYIFYYPSEVQTLDDWIVWLNTHDTFMLYKLETPIITDISPEEMAQFNFLKTYNPNTTMYNDSIADFDIEYALPKDLLDFVLRYGKDIEISGEGFIRFKDGTQICWGRFNIPKQTWNQWGNIWAKNVDVSDCSFPLPFKAGTTPVVNATNSKDEYVCMISKVVASNIGITKVSVARATDGAMSDYDIQYHAIGRWK